MRSSAANEGIEAAEIALSGVQEEQRVGQRTTLDVLDAQQELLNARETLILARRGRVVASFSLLSAMGRLTAEALALPADVYDPTEHYRAVRGKLDRASDAGRPLTSSRNSVSFSPSQAFLSPLVRV